MSEKSLTNLDFSRIIYVVRPHYKPSHDVIGLTDFKGIANVNGCTADMERLSEESRQLRENL